jgi:hypothetical protein
MSIDQPVYHLAKNVSARLHERIESWCGTRSEVGHRDNIMDQMVFETWLSNCQKCKDARRSELLAHLGPVIPPWLR